MPADCHSTPIVALATRGGPFDHHVWQLGPHAGAAIVSAAFTKAATADIGRQLATLHVIRHLTGTLP